MGFSGWMHNTSPNIIFRMNVNGVYICPRIFSVYSNSPAKPAISYKVFAVISLYDARITKPITNKMTKTETNISVGCELTNLKLNMSNKLTMENKSVIFLYLILFTIFLTVLN